ncbi:MAG: signal peptidase I [Gemmatimonadales bacterium]|nr:MAG: signal peptidase I [Gemmatimonadales bacterium]
MIDGTEPPHASEDVPQPGGTSRSGRVGRGFRDAVRSVLLTLAVFFVLRAFVVEAFKIPTSSMESTLLAGDFLLVNKMVYGADLPGVGLSLPAMAEPDFGEVIVFHPPHEPEKHYVKRVVGMPGDTLQMKDKVLLRNGAPVDEPYVRHREGVGDVVHPGMAWQARFHLDAPRVRQYRPTRDHWGPLTVPEGRYFVLGDNRDNSEDSRYWGFVRREDVKGRPWIVYYSSEISSGGGMPFLLDIRWDRIGGRVR